MNFFSDICYSEQTKQLLDVYTPECEEFPVLVYFHGGGLFSGNKGKQPLFVQYLVQNGVAVVSANYRLYPEAKYPDFLEDAAEAVNWVFKNINTYGKATKIYIGGSSAGGYLSQMLCFDKQWLGKHGIDTSDIAGFVHDAGQPTCHFQNLKESGIHPRRIIVDETAPLFHVGTSESYPPMLIIVSDNDIAGRLEQTHLLVETLRQFDQTENICFKVMNGKHCAYIKVLDENGDSVFGKMILEFINQY